MAGAASCRRFSAADDNNNGNSMSGSTVPVACNPVPHRIHALLTLNEYYLFSSGVVIYIIFEKTNCESLTLWFAVFAFYFFHFYFVLHENTRTHCPFAYFFLISIQTILFCFCFTRKHKNALSFWLFFLISIKQSFFFVLHENTKTHGPFACFFVFCLFSFCSKKYNALLESF